MLPSSGEGGGRRGGKDGAPNFSCAVGSGGFFHSRLHDEGSTCVGTREGRKERRRFFTSVEFSEDAIHVRVRPNQRDLETIKWSTDRGGRTSWGLSL